MVSVDPYVNETTAHADVILPAPPHTRSPHYDLALLGFAVRNYARYSPPVVDKGDRPAEWETLLRLAGDRRRRGRRRRRRRARRHGRRQTSPAGPASSPTPIAAGPSGSST